MVVSLTMGERDRIKFLQVEGVDVAMKGTGEAFKLVPKTYNLRQEGDRRCYSEKGKEQDRYVFFGCGDNTLFEGRIMTAFITCDRNPESFISSVEVTRRKVGKEPTSYLLELKTTEGETVQAEVVTSSGLLTAYYGRTRGYENIIGTF